MNLRTLLLVCCVASSNLVSANVFPPNSAVVQLFEWRWDDISKECANLAESGIHYAQVSPPNEHAILPNTTANVWYDRYQPVSYQLGNRSGSKEEFLAMVKSCEEKGVHIIVDAVINHMAIIPPHDVQRYGVLGTGYWRYSFPGLYSHFDFNQCDHNLPDSHIHNYYDRYEVQFCNLAGLADLATHKDYVRNKLAEFLQSFLDAGVTGFRIDAAKHMPSEDIEAIVGRLSPRPLILQEVIGRESESIQVSEYVRNGSVTEFKYSDIIGGRFRDGYFWGIFDDLARLSTLSQNAVVFIDNHDTQRGHGWGFAALTYKNPRRYALANAFMLAYPYGVPVIMSGYRFDDPLGGPPRKEDGLVANVGENCGVEEGPWVCEHRWALIKRTAQWRKLVGNLPVAQGFDGHEITGFSRGNDGFFAVNLDDEDRFLYTKTTLPEGRYCNMLDASFVDNQCPSEKRFNVDAWGFVNANMGPESALATHVSTRIQ